MTNREKLNSLTYDELAHLIAKNNLRSVICDTRSSEYCKSSSCENCIKLWLMEEEGTQR